PGGLAQGTRGFCPRTPFGGGGEMVRAEDAFARARGARRRPVARRVPRCPGRFRVSPFQYGPDEVWRKPRVGEPWVVSSRPPTPSALQPPLSMNTLHQLQHLEENDES